MPTSADRSEAIYAAIKAMPLGRKIVYSAAAVVPIAAVAYGVHGLLGTCPRSSDRNVFLGLFMAGAIFSLLSLAWFLLLFPAVLRAHERLRQSTGVAYILVLLAVIFVIRPIVHAIGQRMDASEHARCDRAQTPPVGHASESRTGWVHGLASLRATAGSTLPQPQADLEPYWFERTVSHGTQTKRQTLATQVSALAADEASSGEKASMTRQGEG